VQENYEKMQIWGDRNEEKQKNVGQVNKKGPSETTKKYQANQKSTKPGEKD